MTDIVNQEIRIRGPEDITVLAFHGSLGGIARAGFLRDQESRSPSETTRAIAAELARQYPGTDTSVDVWTRDGNMGAEVFRDKHHHGI